MSVKKLCRRSQKRKKVSPKENFMINVRQWSICVKNSVLRRLIRLVRIETTEICYINEARPAPVEFINIISLRNVAVSLKTWLQDHYKGKQWYLKSPWHLLALFPGATNCWEECLLSIENNANQRKRNETSKDCSHVNSHDRLTREYIYISFFLLELLNIVFMEFKSWQLCKNAPHFWVLAVKGHERFRLSKFFCGNEFKWCVSAADD